MKKYKAVILDANTQNPGDLNWDYLSEVFELTVYPRTPPELVIERARDADVLIVNKVAITREIADALPKLKYVTTLATGYNQIDTEALAQRNIPVSNIPAYSTGAVAQLVFSFILEFSNRVAHYTDEVKSGVWTACEDFCYQSTKLFELEGKTLGIIGFGKIGRRVYELASAFGMKTLCYTPSGKKSDAENVEFTTLDEVLRRSDIITLHCPLTAATKELVNREFISKMKDKACLINTSRGAVINERDVADALISGKLAYFGADVLSTEPPKSDNPLLSAPNAFLTPHIAWAGFETRVRLLSIVNANAKSFLDGAPINVVNM